MKVNPLYNFMHKIASSRGRKKGRVGNMQILISQKNGGEAKFNSEESDKIETITLNQLYKTSHTFTVIL